MLIVEYFSWLFLGNIMWCIVCFEFDNTIAAVPQFWFKNNVCAWPIKSTNKYIERRANPNELEFKYYKSKMLHKNIGIY